jgi:hypothetical protein
MLERNFKEDNTGRVGFKWWHNLIKRNKAHLTIGKAVRFDMKRNEWCKLENFKQMYNVIYPKLSEIGISEMWETEKMLDKGGNIVTDETYMCGRPTKFNLVKPNKLPFVDEVGVKTTQANDGN